MAIIAPFQAWRYDATRVPITQVITQPYDKITPEMQERYYASSPNNLVRIILGQRLPGDGDRDNVYTRAATNFADWRRAGVLRQDSRPCLHRYSQTFPSPAGSKTLIERQGYIALGRLEDYSAGVVYRHELTHSKPKADRLDLLRATRAHFEQIFMLYDGTPEIDGLLQSAAPADIEVTDEYGVIHRVWRICDPAVIGGVQTAMQSRKLIIADGHHRYETALTYRDERRACAPTAAAPYDSMMMTFFNMDSPSLVVLPTHRVVYGLPSFSSAQLQAGALQFFNVEQVDSAIDGSRAAAILREAGHAGTALIAATADRVLLMHAPKAIGTTRFAGLSLRQQSLDVVQLHKCLLEGVLKISEEAIRNLQNVSYHRDADDALAQVRSGQAQAAFLMNPVRIEQIRDIAFAGEVLPQKSTDFYPKLLSGLTIYSME